MLRTIMLLPLNNSIGLTTITISLIRTFQKKGLRVLFFKPLYKNHNSIDDTTYLLSKYFSIKSIPIDTDIKHRKFFTHELYIKHLVKYNLELYYKYCSDYDIVFIEGIRTCEGQYYIHDFNMQLIQQLCPELFFYTSCNNNVEDFLNHVYCYYREGNIKKHSFNIIINNIYYYPNRLYGNVTCYNKHSNKNFINKFDKKILNIPIDNNILKILLKKIFIDLKVYTSFKDYSNFYLIESFILYDEFFLKQYKYFKNNILVMPFNIYFVKFLEKFKNIFSNFNIHSILLTNVHKYHIHIINAIKVQFSVTISIFYTSLNINNVVDYLKKQYKNYLKKNILYSKNMIDIFIKYFNTNDFIKNYIYKHDIYYKSISSFLFKKQLIEKAQKICKNILLPEGEDIRIIKATAIVSSLNIAQCTLLGDFNIIHSIMKNENIKFSHNVKIINPVDIKKQYIKDLLFLRSSKGMTKDIADVYINDNMVLGALMLYNNQADGLVCGIKYSSADVLRPALQIIGTISNKKDHSCSLISSIFFMLFDRYVIVYGDCAININPNVEQLAEIAIQSANLASQFFIEPRIAMLSYSTQDSGCGDTVDKVRKATQLVKKKRPDLIIEGPIQYDAASNSLISKLKFSNSCLHGESNIFIFPDLNSGNITYKAVQQTSHIISIGPILQGLKKPINDLSRGATVDDIIYTIAVTAIQSNNK